MDTIRYISSFLPSKETLENTLSFPIIKTIKAVAGVAALILAFKHRPKLTLFVAAFWTLGYLAKNYNHKFGKKALEDVKNNEPRALPLQELQKTPPFQFTDLLTQTSCTSEDLLFFFSSLGNKKPKDLDITGWEPPVPGSEKFMKALKKTDKTDEEILRFINNNNQKKDSQLANEAKELEDIVKIEEEYMKDIFYLHIALQENTALQQPFQALVSEAKKAPEKLPNSLILDLDRLSNDSNPLTERPIGPSSYSHYLACIQAYTHFSCDKKKKESLEKLKRMIALAPEKLPFMLYMTNCFEFQGHLLFLKSLCNKIQAFLLTLNIVVEINTFRSHQDLLRKQSELNTLYTEVKACRGNDPNLKTKLLNLLRELSEIKPQKMNLRLWDPSIPGSPAFMTRLKEILGESYDKAALWKAIEETSVEDPDSPVNQVASEIYFPLGTELFILSIVLPFCIELKNKNHLLKAFCSICKETAYMDDFLLSIAQLSENATAIADACKKTKLPLTTHPQDIPPTSLSKISYQHMFAKVHNGSSDSEISQELQEIRDVVERHLKSLNTLKERQTEATTLESAESLCSQILMNQFILTQLTKYSVRG